MGFYFYNGSDWQKKTDRSPRFILASDCDFYICAAHFLWLWTMSFFLVLPFHVAKVQSSSTRLGAAAQKTNDNVAKAYPLCFCHCSAVLHTHKSLNE